MFRRWELEKIPVGVLQAYNVVNDVQKNLYGLINGIPSLFSAQICSPLYSGTPGDKDLMFQQVFRILLKESMLKTYNDITTRLKGTYTICKILYIDTFDLSFFKARFLPSAN